MRPSPRDQPVYADRSACCCGSASLVLLVYGGLLYLTYYGFTKAPAGFIPTQDKGYLLVNVQLPDATSVEHTQRVMQRIEKLAIKIPGVSHTVAIAGQSLLLNANAPNYGSMYVMLDDFHHRTKPSLHGEAIADAARRTSSRRRSSRAQVKVFGRRRSRAWAPPAVQDRRSRTAATWAARRSRTSAEKIVGKRDDGETDSRGLQDLFTSFRANTPWLDLNIDRSMVKTLGVSMSELFNTLQVYLGSLYVNDFNRFGRTWQVNVQGDATLPQADRGPQAAQGPQRSRATWCRSVSMASIADREGPGADHALQHVPRRGDQRQPRAGDQLGPGDRPSWTTWSRSSCPQAMRTEWTELALLQLQTGNTAMLVFVLAVVLVFLVLAAQYESWSLPLAVILVVPMCLLCSVAGVLDGADGHQHLHAGRLHRPGRPGVQERHPDRRVRQGRARGGRPPLPGDARRLPVAAPADHDDVVRVHPRRGAAGARRGGRRRDAADARHGRLQRHARRDALRHLPDPGLLLRHPVVQRPPDRGASRRRRVSRCRAATVPMARSRRATARDGTVTPGTAHAGRGSRVPTNDRPPRPIEAALEPLAGHVGRIRMRVECCMAWIF